jgi:CBS-domain-containing membrane protein
MREHHTRRLPVVDKGGALVGLLSLDDLACEAARTLRGGVNDELRNLVLEVHLSNQSRTRAAFTPSCIRVIAQPYGMATALPIISLRPISVYE